MNAPTVVAAARPRLRGWLHATAAPVAAAGTVALWQAASTQAGRLTALVFGLCMVGLYTASSLYHVAPWSARVRRVLGRCDAVMILCMIAGTFTPIAFHALHGAWRTVSLLVAWAIVLTGMVLILAGLRLRRWTRAVVTVAIGWLSVIPFTKIVLALPWQASTLIALGGLLYTLGALVYAKRWPDPAPRWFGYHEVFHLLVVAASTVHYIAIWRYVLPGG